MVPILFGAFVLEHRAYNKEDTSEEQLKAIQSRISTLDDDILYYLELPCMTEFSTHILFDELERVLQEKKFKAILFDLSQAAPPSSQVREILYQRFETIIPQIGIYSFTTGKNAIINIALKFFINSRKNNLRNAKFAKTKEKAIANIYEEIGRK